MHGTSLHARPRGIPYRSESSLKACTVMIIIIISDFIHAHAILWAFTVFRWLRVVCELFHGQMLQLPAGNYLYIVESTLLFVA